MPIYAFEGRRPVISSSAYVSPTAVIIGNITIGERCYIGHGAILRGDYGAIEIGNETAVEEGVVVHARPNDETRIGNRVTLGHGAMIHNATIEDGAVIGMRAVVSDYAKVGAGAIVGEMGLVKNSQEIPPFKVAVGAPAKVVCDVEERHQMMSKRAKEIYVDLAERYASGGLVELEPHSRTRTAVSPLIPIGVIHTPFKEAAGTPIQGALSSDVEGEVVLDPAFRRGLEDLVGFSHIILIYTFHQIDGFKLKMKPYLDENERGIFATRSPCRPNPIGMTVVRLLGIDGCRLKISGVDMLDGTPLLDIKPSVPLFDRHEPARCGWFEPHLKALSQKKTVPIADDRFHRNDDGDRR
jgi:tRNA-Thr(GGU) m(6)t(6)A37 methyltransferase TsaA